MTPERLAEIRDRVTYNPEDWPITIELVAHIDTITAEIATLRTRLDALVTAGGAQAVRLNDWANAEIENGRPSDRSEWIAYQKLLRRNYKHIADALAAAVREAKEKE